jgi:hypothetical protein
MTVSKGPEESGPPAAAAEKLSPGEKDHIRFRQAHREGENRRDTQELT